MVEQQSVPFHNKIFLCDIIGYSQRDPVEQQECHALIVRLALKTLEQVGAGLDRDVIALPTGDGLALNFKTDAPDIHLRTALEMLRMLDEHNRRGGPRVELRTGLNTHVDAIVTDVNGKENIVGTGINEAQRVMDLGDHAQVLLPKAAADELRIYKQYQGRFRDLGEHVVKHDRVLSVVQYVDPACPFLNNQPPSKRKLMPKTTVGLADIRRQRVKEKLLRVELRGADRGSLDDVRDYVSDFLDEHGSFQHLKIAVEWVASEMLDNVFRHGRLAPEDQLSLTLDLTRHGILISTDQPVVPNFDLDGILKDERYDLRFLAMMNRRGFKLDVLREHGRTSVSCELPLDVRIWALGPGEAEPRAKAGEAPKSGRARGFEFARKALAGGASLLILSGPLDHEALNRLQPAVDDLGRRGPLKLILDLAAVPWLPSVGIAWLVATESRAREKGGRLIIIRAPAKVRYVLDRMMLGDLLTIAPDLEAAGRLFEGGSATAAQAADR